MTSSCKHDEEKTTWETDMLAPLVTTTITIDDLVNDSLLAEGADSSVSVVYRSLLYSLTAAEILDIPDTNLRYNVSLDSLKLDTRTINRPISLGELATQIGGIIGAFIINSNGQDTIIPPLAGLSSGNFDLDATSFFETAVIQSGFMDIEVNNGFPIDLTNVIFELRNKVGLQVILTDTFPSIPAGQVRTNTIDMSGKDVEGELLMRVINMDSPGSTGKVTVDTSDALNVTVTIRDIRLFSATAIFPEQNIIDLKQAVIYDMRPAELTYFTFKEGVLRVRAISTIQDSIYFTFSVPKAIDPQGQPLIAHTVAPPAPPGDTVQVIETYDLEGYSIDITGPLGDTFNIFETILTGRIDSTGRLVSISLSDSIYVYYGLLDIVPEYAVGYFGDTVINHSGGATFDLFDRIHNGSFDLELLNMNIVAENWIGADGRLKLNSMQSQNTVTTVQQPLSGTIVGTEHDIQRGKPAASVWTTITLDNSNSNGTDLIELLPNMFTYDIDFTLNPFGDVLNRGDWVYSHSAMDLNLDMEIPLSLVANQLTMTDTVAFGLGGDPEDENITSGILKLFVNNGFPLSADVQVYLYDEAGILLDSLFSNTTIDAADIDANCRVSEHVLTKLIAPANEEKISILHRTDHAVIRAEFNTTTKTCASSYIKIYSDYTMDVKLIGDFNYTVKGGR